MPNSLSLCKSSAIATVPIIARRRLLVYGLEEDIPQLAEVGRSQVPVEPHVKRVQQLAGGAPAPVMAAADITIRTVDEGLDELDRGTVMCFRQLLRRNSEHVGRDVGEHLGVRCRQVDLQAPAQERGRQFAIFIACDDDDWELIRLDSAPVY